MLPIYKLGQPDHEFEFNFNYCLQWRILLYLQSKCSDSKVLALPHRLLLSWNFKCSSTMQFWLHLCYYRSNWPNSMQRRLHVLLPSPCTGCMSDRIHIDSWIYILLSCGCKLYCWLLRLADASHLDHLPFRLRMSKMLRTTRPV
jgi:hypothetical protein